MGYRENLPNDELLQLYEIGNALTRGRLNRYLESDRVEFRATKKEIKRRGFQKIGDLRAAVRLEREQEYERLRAERDAQILAEMEVEETSGIDKAQDDLIYEIATELDCSTSVVEEILYAVYARMREAGAELSEDSVRTALEALVRDLEVESLNALYEM